VRPPRGSERYTWVNSTSTNEERRNLYALLRAAGFTVADAMKMRDYRDEIIQKRIDIIEAAFVKAKAEKAKEAQNGGQSSTPTGS
jgi:ABC-type proline/glycine betaine transport system substrate-binding protein